MASSRCVWFWVIDGPQNNCIVIHTIKIRIMIGAGINYKKWSLVCLTLSLLQLMNQIDILLTNQYEGNQKEKELLRDQVQARDKEIISLRVTVKEKSAQVSQGVWV